MSRGTGGDGCASVRAQAGPAHGVVRPDPHRTFLLLIYLPFDPDRWRGSRPVRAAGFLDFGYSFVYVIFEDGRVSSRACRRTRRRSSGPDATGLGRRQSSKARRLRPKFMTMATTCIGFIPIMLATGTGSDVWKRIAAPMLGGILTSFLLELIVYPAIYEVWKSRGQQHMVPHAALSGSPTWAPRAET